MDEKNGKAFVHNSELFPMEMGNPVESEPLKDILHSSGIIDPSGISKNIPLLHPHSSNTSQENIWAHEFGCNESAAGLLVNQNKNVFNLSLAVPPLEIPVSEVENTGSLLDTLVKSMPSENILDHYSTSPIANKDIDADYGSTMGDNSSQQANLGCSHLISGDKVTHDLVGSVNKLESQNMLVKYNDCKTNSWNGLICDPFINTNFHLQNQLSQNLQGSLDKNGNTSLFNSPQIDKISSGLNHSEHFCQSNFMTRLSPSGSLETSVRTPATSYESASPLSNNRTPIRSDESISPMGSGHTPLRVEESTSPLANIKTPIRVEEGSPVRRTPVHVEESFSPVGSSILTSNSPSHKPNGPAQGLDSNYCSPSSVFRKADPKSPSLNFLSSPVKLESQENGKRTEKKFEMDEGSAINVQKAACSEIKKMEENLSESAPDDVNKNFNTTLSKSQANKKLLIPFVSAKRLDDTIVNEKSAKRTLTSNSDSESELHGDSSLLSGKNEFDVNSLAFTESCDVKTDITVPEVEKNKLSDAQKLSQGDEFFIKSKRRRKKSDNMSVPNFKRKGRKKVTIYQSLMSPEETGIKLKIKVASSFQRIKPQKKRRSKKEFDSDEDEENGSKKCKKIVRFSNNVKESKVSEQTEWGSKIPPELLHRIFQIVVEEQGCVPSLVRFSLVCKLWNTVANRTELWQNIDLSSPYIKQKCKIDRYFRWLLENRLENIRELNLSGWKFSNITMVLSLIGTHCTDIESIGLAGWQGLHYEHLKSLLQDCPRLSKLDLSDVSPESKSANSAVSQKSITFLTHTMSERLTQLILAHNTLTNLPQIINSLATHCPNLQVLDFSNIRRVSHTEFALNVEQLQEGCQKLKILRITNSCITLANVPLEKQVASPGFVHLEELSIAGHQGTESLRITSVMDDNCLERILKTSNKLKLLDVRGCTRVTDSSLVRVPAWDIQHLFLSGSYVTRQCGSGLELIAQKWCHSLVEVDLAWTTVTEDLNAAIMAFAEKGSESPLRVMNLCGSSVTLEPVKALLSKCRNLESLNLQSCRGLPRGIKRLYENEQLLELRNFLNKKDRDSILLEGDERRESESDGRRKESPFYSTNSKNDDDLVT